MKTYDWDIGLTIIATIKGDVTARASGSPLVGVRLTPEGDTELQIVRAGGAKKVPVGSIVLKKAYVDSLVPSFKEAFSRFGPILQLRMIVSEIDLPKKPKKTKK